MAYGQKIYQQPGQIPNFTGTKQLDADDVARQGQAEKYAWIVDNCHVKEGTRVLEIGFGKLDYVIAAGGDFRHSIRPVDKKGRKFPLAGYVARMQGRKKDGTVIFDLTGVNMGAVVDSANDRILITILAAETTTFDFNNGVYDLEIFNASTMETRKLQVGKLFLEREVTK